MVADPANANAPLNSAHTTAMAIAALAFVFAVAALLAAYHVLRAIWGPDPVQLGALMECVLWPALSSVVVYHAVRFFLSRSAAPKPYTSRALGGALGAVAVAFATAATYVLFHFLVEALGASQPGVGGGFEAALLVGFGFTTGFFLVVPVMGAMLGIFAEWCMKVRSL